MTTCLRYRLTAGAALTTGLLAAGVATAVPAHAQTTVSYSCTATVDGVASEPVAVSVTMDTNAPASIAPGETLTVDSVTAVATFPLPGVTPESIDTSAVSMTVPVDAPVRTSAGPAGQVSTTLTSESIVVGDGEVRVSLASTESQSVVVPAEAAGMTVEVLTPPSLTGTLTAPDMTTTVDCDTPSTQVIDTVVVTSPQEGTTDTEPGDGDTSEGPVDGEPSPVAPAPADQPVVPQVVQTDGLAPTSATSGDAAAHLLGGLLLAGASAGAVLVVRRRAAQH